MTTFYIHPWNHDNFSIYIHETMTTFLYTPMKPWQLFFIHPRNHDNFSINIHEKMPENQNIYSRHASTRVLITGNVDMAMKWDAASSTRTNSLCDGFIPSKLIDMLGRSSLLHFLAPRRIVANDNARALLPVQINIRCCGHAPWGAIFSERTPRVNGEVPLRFPTRPAG